MRNRYRRSKLTVTDREEITPKNIILKGPTGVGKTEIARRLAKLVKAPFVKVEATKFTEVGYVGRDVESMIRDLVEVSVRLVKEEKFKEVERKAGDEVDKILLKHITPLRKSVYPDMSAEQLHDKVYEEYKSGALDDMVIEIDMPELPKPQQLMPGSGIEINMGELLGGMLPQRKKRRKITVKKAYDQLLDVESEKLIDNDSVNAERSPEPRTRALSS